MGLVVVVVVVVVGLLLPAIHRAYGIPVLGEG